MHPKQMREALRLFKRIDLFGAPVTLNIDGRSSYQSVFGAFMTIGMIILSFIILLPTLLSYLNREEVIVQITQFFESTPPEVSLSDQTFMFFASITQPEQYPYSEQPFAIIEMIYTIKNESDRQRTPVKLIPCKNRNFSKEIENTLSNIQNKRNLSQYLCLPQNFTMDLFGAYLTPVFKYAKFEVKQCVNQTNLTADSSWNYTCPPDKIVQEYYQANAFLEFQLYSMNYVVNPAKSDGYVQQYLSEDLNFKFQPAISYTEVNIFLSEYDIRTDHSIFMDSEYRDEVFVIREESQTKTQTTFEFRQNRNLSSVNTNSAMTVYIRSGNISTKVLRSFRKLDYVLSYFGGFIQIFVVIFGVFMKYYNNQYFLLRLANKIYDFKENREKFLSNLPDNRISKLNTILFQAQERQMTRKMRSKSPMKSSVHEDDSQKLLAVGFRDKSELLEVYYNYFLKSTESFSPGAKYFIYLLSCGKIFGSDHNRLIDQAVKRAEKDINIKNIMKDISSHKYKIRKLTKWLLNPEQRILLNYNPKPRLSLYNLYIKQQEKAKPLSTQTLNDTDKLRSAYQIRSSVRKIDSMKFLNRKELSAYLKFECLVDAFEKINEHQPELQNRLLINRELLTVLLAAINLNLNHKNIQLEENMNGKSAIVNINQSDGFYLAESDENQDIHAQKILQTPYRNVTSRKERSM